MSNPNWHTPPEWIERVRTVLGTIDLDPCSDPVANARIGATNTYYGAGEVLPWAGNVFCNPVGTPQGPKKFFARCVKHFAENRYGSVGIIYLAYNLGQLVWAQDYLDKWWCYVCIPRQRIRFLNEKGLPGGSPRYDNAFVYFGAEPNKFRETFPGLHLTVGR